MILAIIVISIGLIVVFPVLESKGRGENVAVVLIGTFGLPLLFSLGGIVLISGISRKFEVKYYNNLPQFAVQAKAISKSVDVSSYDLYVAGGDGTGTDGSPGQYETIVKTSYLVCFEFNNICKVFEVNEQKYMTISENEIGVLSYKNDEEKLIFFDFKSE